MTVIKYISVVILSTLFYCPTSEAQTKSNPFARNQSGEHINILHDTLKTKTDIDTLNIQNLPNGKDTSQNDRPWKITLIVGLLVFIATITSSLITRTITLNGINTNKDIAIRQIENLQAATLHQFNSTLKTKNRQDWINDVRNSSSEIIANCVKINIEFQDSGINNKEKVKEIHKKITNSCNTLPAS